MVRIKELAIQNVLERKYRERGWGVKREVSTPVGYIDLLLWKPRRDGSIERVLIECKERGGLKSAVGQVEMYGKYEKCDRKVIIYFSYDSRDRSIPDSYYLLPGIEIESINRMFDINEVIEEQYRLDGVNQSRIDDINQYKVEQDREEEICQEVFTSAIVLEKKGKSEVQWKSSLNQEQMSLEYQRGLEDIKEVQLAKEREEELERLGLIGIQSEDIMW